MSNLNDLTAQEVYNTVKAHLIKQGDVSFDGRGDCAYRGDNGRSCAVGCLIPDDEYDFKMEGQTVDSLLDECDLELSHDLRGFLTTHRKLLKDLQWVHDDNDPSDWPKILAEVAKTHNLVP